MINLIKSDLYRIFKGKAVYIATLITIIFTILNTYQLNPGWVGVNNSILDQNTEQHISKKDQEKIYKANSIIEERKIMKKYPYEVDKAILGANANLYYLFIVIIVIVITTDFSNNTIKNTISSTIARNKYYFSKLITAILLCTITIIINNYGTYFINILINGPKFSSNLIEITKITIYQLPLMYGIISLLLSISTITKKTSTFNTITIPLIMTFQLLILGFISLFKVNHNILLYEYQVALYNLTFSKDSTYIFKIALLGIIYIIIFNTIGYNFFKKTEIK